MYDVTQNYSCETPLGRFGLIKGQYRLSAQTVFPGEWRLYIAHQSFRAESAAFLLLVTCLLATALSHFQRRHRAQSEGPCS